MNSIKSILVSALLLAGLSWAEQEEKHAIEAQPQEKAAYIPLGNESFLVDQYRLAQDGIVLGAGPGQWTPFLTGGTVSGNMIQTSSAAPALLLSNTIYDMNQQGQWQIMTAMNYASTLLSGTVTSPLGPNQDPFYGSGFFGGLSVSQGWVLGFSLTKTKIYAVYCRLPTAQNILNDYFSFTYYVPLANRAEVDWDTLSLVIDSVDNFFSYRSNGFELLRITRPGIAIAQKFRIADYGGVEQEVTMPESLQLAIGALIPPEAGIPNTACQQTVFNACVENIECAYRSLCQYAPIQTAGFDFNMESSYSFITVIENSHVLSCYKGDKCPVLSDCSCAKPSSCSSSSSSSCSSSSSSSSSCSSSSSSDCYIVCPAPIHCSSSSSSWCEPEICIPHCSSSSTSYSSESTEQCAWRRAQLRRRGFIFPF